MVTEAESSHNHEGKLGMLEFLQNCRLIWRTSKTNRYKTRSQEEVRSRVQIPIDAKLESHDADGGVVGGAGIFKRPAAHNQLSYPFGSLESVTCYSTSQRHLKTSLVKLSSSWVTNLKYPSH
jgi:hypothetical protein